MSCSQDRNRVTVSEKTDLIQLIASKLLRTGIQVYLFNPKLSILNDMATRYINIACDNRN